MTVYQRVVIIAAVCLCIGGIMMLLDVPFMTKGMKQKYTDESVKLYYKKAEQAATISVCTLFGFCFLLNNLSLNKR